MSLSAKDRKILRDLARKQAEVAALPVQQEKTGLWRRVNRLEKVRPLIMLRNGTWHETQNEIAIECEEEWAREQETGLKRQLYHWEHMRDDTVYEPNMYSPIVITGADYGIAANPTRPDHVFGAAYYNQVIADNEDPQRIQLPKISVDREETERGYQRLCDVYGGILNVVKRGIGGSWFSIMDNFITWRGLDQAMLDMLDRPAWVHAWMRRMTDFQMSLFDQYEQLNLLALNNGPWGVGPGGLGVTDELPQPDFDGTHVRTRDMWGFATTQIFSVVSPAMHDEFALAYEKRFLSRFGLTGYGCCEPLHNKLDIVKKIPNLRRVSVSPWADVAVSAESLGNRYVFSYKPNPAILGMETWDIKYVRQQLRNALDLCRGCVVEVLMKDLHTCRNEPRRMWEWVRMAMELAEEYA